MAAVASGDQRCCRRNRRSLTEIGRSRGRREERDEEEQEQGRRGEEEEEGKKTAGGGPRL
eukprot:755517-Hanusia_phi.AAC.4